MNNLTEVIKFTRGPGKYKYTAYLKSGKKVNFGDSNYQHYKDSVPRSLGGGLWSHKNHLDPERRRLYRLRHGGIVTKSGESACKIKYSACWFSYNYLW